MLRSVAKDYFVAYLGAQADRTQKRFDSASGIKHAAHIIVSKILDTACKTCERVCAGIETVIHEAALRRNEHANRACRLQFWTEQAMEDFYACILCADYASAVAKSFGECAAKVIGYLRLNLQWARHVEGRATSNSDVIGSRIVQPEIIHECSNLSVVLSTSDGSKDNNGNCR
jgi:hypothetical protein